MNNDKVQKHKQMSWLKYNGLINFCFQLTEIQTESRYWHWQFLPLTDTVSCLSALAEMKTLLGHCGLMQNVRYDRVLGIKMNKTLPLME